MHAPPATTSNASSRANTFRVAKSATARDINRRIVMHLIRTSQPLSRADLARRSGLQRSTISLIIEQLIAERWVVEVSVGRLPRGRRPVYLCLNRHRAIIGIDIRPIHTTLGIADVGGRFLSQEVIPTSADPDAFLECLISRVKRLSKAHPAYSIEGIGASLPGRINSETGRFVFGPNLAWRNVDLKTPVERATGLSLELENAANACALAEMWFGPNADAAENLVVVTVSEGIGTGVVAKGQLVAGANGMAGEFGHVSLDPEGPLCKCGNRGCWEVFASNSAAIRYYAGSSGRGGARTEPGFSDILSLAEQGDATACAALEKMSRYLGLGIAMLVAGLDPSLVLVVGEVTRCWGQVGPIIESVVAKYRIAEAKVRIIPADYREQPRLRGTIALVLQNHFGAPAFM